MKKKETLIALYLISIGIIYFSCQKENIDIANKESIDIANNVISPEVLEKIAFLGLNTDDVRFETVIQPDGSVDQCYIAEDCEITLSQLKEIPLLGDKITKQFRAYNLVNKPKVIKVLGLLEYNRYGSIITPKKIRDGLRDAIANYNQLGLKISFTLNFGSSTNGYDIIVKEDKNLTEYLGFAGFPSGGKPYNSVKLSTDLKNYSADNIEYTITHEIGHCIGLKHTNRSSSSGAVQIPSTPRKDSKSIMNTGKFNSNGEFSHYDVLALLYLYNYRAWLIAK